MNFVKVLVWFLIVLDCRELGWFLWRGVRCCGLVGFFGDFWYVRFLGRVVWYLWWISSVIK